MKIIDAQVHIWSSGKPSGIHRPVPVFSAEELLTGMDGAGVDAALIHPPSWDPASNDMAVEAVRAHPGRFAIMANLELNRPETRETVEHWKTRARPGQLGLRTALVLADQKTWHNDGTLDWFWPAAERSGVAFATMAWRFLPVFRGIAERHPKLKLIIDHFGLIRSAQDEAAFANIDELLSLAQLPNVAIKATGAPGYSSHDYPFRNIHDGLHRIFDAYGPERFFWGTDITRMPCSYRQCVTMFTEELPWLQGAELEQVMGRGLCRWIGWDLL